MNKALNTYLASMTTVEVSKKKSYVFDAKENNVFNVFQISPDELEGKWPMNVLYSLYYEFSKRFPFSRVNGIRQEATSAKSTYIPTVR